MIQEGNRVSGKMRFHGYHRQELFGVVPSGRHVSWIGMPIFTFEGPKVQRPLRPWRHLRPNRQIERARRQSPSVHRRKYFRLGDLEIGQIR